MVLIQGEPSGVAPHLLTEFVPALALPFVQQTLQAVEPDDVRIPLAIQRVRR